MTLPSTTSPETESRSRAVAEQNGGPRPRPLPIVFDTDLGTDVDDLQALAFVLGSPELHLAGVTTAYGDTALRARIATRALRLARRAGVPVTSGPTRTLSGREVWWAGFEGTGIPDLDEEPAVPTTAVHQLITAEHILATAPLTSLGRAFRASPRITPSITLMGGDFRPAAADGERETGVGDSHADGERDTGDGDGHGGRTVEHNIVSDALAASIVFASRARIDVVGVDQTLRVHLTPEAIAAIGEVGPLGRLVAEETAVFLTGTGRALNCPHDAIAALMLVRPDLFTFATGRVEVVTSGPGEGLTTFTPEPGGRHRIVTDFDPALVTGEIVTRILAGCALSR